MNFMEKLNTAIRKNKSLLCVGLDPDLARMPENVAVFDFNKAIIEATGDLVCAYKPNLAFYEVLGDEGMTALRRTLNIIPSDIPVIADAKRGDIGNTARAYARAIFDDLGFDATTVNPYLGFDSVAPFLDYREKGVFILCRTSNAGAVDFQSLRVAGGGDSSFALFELVARKASEWNKNGNIGLVVGATCPEELSLIREQHPDMLLLIPGVGAQGGDLASVVRYGVNQQGEGAIINSSRQVLYASHGADFSAAARRSAGQLRDKINQCLAGRNS